MPKILGSCESCHVAIRRRGDSIYCQLCGSGPRHAECDARHREFCLEVEVERERLLALREALR